LNDFGRQHLTVSGTRGGLRGRKKKKKNKVGKSLNRVVGLTMILIVWVIEKEDTLASGGNP